MRIVVVHNRHRSASPSGEDRVVEQETSLLTAAGHHVERFDRSNDEAAGMSLPSKATLPSRLVWNGAERRRMSSLLDRFAPDVVHVHNTFPLMSPSVLAACESAAVPTVASIHNYRLVCISGDLLRDERICTDCVGRVPWRGAVHGCYDSSVLRSTPLAISTAVNHGRWLRSVRRFLCLSSAQRSMLERGGFPADRIVVKPNVVEEPSRQRNGPGRHVLFLGRLTPEKGIHVLRSAWDALGGSAVPLVIAGSGAEEAATRAWAAGRDDVEVIGQVDKARSVELLADAVVTVTPSLAPETFGLVVVEAMAAGVPVIGTNRGALPDLIDHGRTGLLVPPGDVGALAAAIRQLVGDPAANAAMGAAARLEYLDKYTPGVGLARLEEIYAEVSAPGADGRWSR